MDDVHKVHICPRQNPKRWLLRSQFAIILEKVERRNIAEKIKYIFSFSGFVLGIIPDPDTKKYDVGRHPEGTYIFGDEYMKLSKSHQISPIFENYGYCHFAFAGGTARIKSIFGFRTTNDVKKLVSKNNFHIRYIMI